MGGTISIYLHVASVSLITDSDIIWLLLTDTNNCWEHLTEQIHGSAKQVT